MNAAPHHCPFCSQPLPPSEFKLKPPFYVRRFDQCVRLTNLQYRIVEALRYQRRTINDLISILYDDNANGGPDNAVGVIHVSIMKAKRKLGPVKLRIVSTRGRTAYYTLQVDK